jgi:AraC-like DNA-binding protein
MFSPVGGELMADKHYFPVHAGMLTEEHRERIGKAAWEFLWCLSKTTKETIEDGERVGIVLGGKPITFKEVADEFGISRSTVRRNFEILELENYISLLETPRGHVIKVMRSKKFKDARDSKTDTGSKIDTPQWGSSSAQGGSKTEHSNKDIKKDIKITTTAEARKSNQQVDTGMPPSVTKEIVSTSTAVIQCYLELRGRMVETSHDQTAALKIERAGVPADMAVKLVRECFANFEKTKKYDSQKINSLS